MTPELERAANVRKLATTMGESGDATPEMIGLAAAYLAAYATILESRVPSEASGSISIGSAPQTHDVGLRRV